MTKKIKQPEKPKIPLETTKAKKLWEQEAEKWHDLEEDGPVSEMEVLHG